MSDLLTKCLSGLSWARPHKPGAYEGWPLRRVVGFLMGLVMSATFLYFFLRGFHFKEFIGVLLQVNYFNYVWVLLVTAAFLCARAIKWKIILAPVKRITLLSALGNIAIGLMGNNVLPARGGEILRVGSLSRTERVRAASVASALVVERLFDGYVLIFFFMFGSWRIELSSVHGMDMLRNAAAVVFGGYSVMLLGLSVFVKYGNMERLRKMAPGKLGFVIQKIDEFKAGLFIIKDPRRLLLICFWSVVIWSLNAALVLVTLSMFVTVRPDVYETIGFTESMLLIGAVSLGLIIPAAPGYFGTYDWIYATILMGIGMPRSFSNSFVIFSHGSQYIVMTTLGLIFFWRNHLRRVGDGNRHSAHL